MKDWCTAAPQGGVRLAVQVMPNAKRTEVIGALDGVLKIRLQAQPVEGKANDALVRYIADALEIPKSAVAITHGHTGKRKMIEVAVRGLTIERVRQALAPANG